MGRWLRSAVANSAKALAPPPSSLALDGSIAGCFLLANTGQCVAYGVHTELFFCTAVADKVDTNP